MKNFIINEEFYSNVATQIDELMITKIEIKLSHLKLGDRFKFIEGQVAKYYENDDSKKLLMEYPTNSFSEFVVLKVNKVSVLCKTNNITFIFRHTGEGYQLQKGTMQNKSLYTSNDCNIVII